MSGPDIPTALRALADETRLALARLLLEGPFNVGEIQEIFGLGQSTASYHLKILTEAGLLAGRREGRLIYYQWDASLSPPIEALQAFAREHAPALDAEARRRVHRVFDARSERTRRFFDGPGGDAAGFGQASERAGCGGVDVVGRIVERLPAGSVAADLGTGSGRLLGPLLERAARVIGIDASPRMLDRARTLAGEHGWQNVELRLGTLEHLPLRDAEVDVAVAHQVLHHAAQPAIALAEAFRVVKPGGQLIIGDFLPHDREWMREELADQWLGFDPESFSRLLRNAGFTQLEVVRQRGAENELGMFVVSARRPAVARVADASDRTPSGTLSSAAVVGTARAPRRNAVKRPSTTGNALKKTRIAAQGARS